MEQKVMEITTAIWADMDDRRGFELGSLDKEVQDEIIKSWKEKITAILEEF